MKQNIVLIGFMAAGKSTVGKLLARLLGKKYMSTDAEIEKRAGKKISQIFNQEGEIKFREREIAVIKKLARSKNTVIDCGGGVVLNKINIDRLKENGLIFLLEASPEAILKRIKRQKSIRPLLNVKDPLLAIKRLLRFRQPFYKAAADYRIKTDQASIKEVANQIMKCYYEHVRKEF